jgi:pimeloyl-ACP methyl ester carboxylesterase
MEEKLTITAISGWAIPKDWFAEQIKEAFPGSDIHVIYPENPENEEEARNILSRLPAQLYIGYSLGSLWLIKYQDHLPQNCHKAILAPILAFLNTGGLGGKTSETQLKYLIKILSRNLNKEDVLRDFFFHANLPYPEKQIKDIPKRNILIKGLKFLENNSVTGKETNDFLSIIGENDTFLDARILKRHIPHIEIVEDAGHSPTPLLKQLAKKMRHH